MSLETDVSNLVTKANTLIDYFNGKKSAIDTAVNAAIAAIPDTARTWWVDPVNGLDSNAGNSRTAPFKTIVKAMASTPNSGQCIVNLLGDYTMDTTMGLNVSYLTIYGIDAVSSGVTPKIKFKYMLFDSAGTPSVQLAGFILYSFSASIELRNVDIDLPSPAGLSIQPSNTRICTAFKTNAGSVLPPAINVTLQAVKVTKAADFFGALIGQAASAVNYQTVNCTFPSDMAGKHINTVAAGTDLKILTNVMTNMGTL